MFYFSLQLYLKHSGSIKSFWVIFFTCEVTHISLHMKNMSILSNFNLNRNINFSTLFCERVKYTMATGFWYQWNINIGIVDFNSLLRSWILWHAFVRNLQQKKVNKYHIVSLKYIRTFPNWCEPIISSFLVYIHTWNIL